VKRHLAIALVAAAALAFGACSSNDGESANAASDTPVTEQAQPKAPSSTQPSSEPRGDAHRGKELVEQFECHRCHEGIAEVEPIVDQKHCVRCHQQVMDGKFRHKPENDRWQKNVAHLTAVPSLAAMHKRLQYDWVVAFVTEPHDLRPALEPTMPRLPLTREQARDIASYLMPEAEKPAEVKLDGADPKRGRRLLEEKACGTCHRFTGVDPLPGAPTTAARETRQAVFLAPDLRHARDRLEPSLVVAWLLDPLKVKPGTLMPQTPMSEAEARDIAAYILEAELAPVPSYRLPALPQPLDRPVGYAEVAERVFEVTCRHCHGDPDVARGDGGPGNTGGFGFKPRGLELTSYERVLAGYLDDHGERGSVFAKTDDGVPRIVATLMARHAELAGKPDPEVRGMPLGLPPVPIEDIQLLVTWIAQGRPR
jgi:mono/diheme cytochrome c family protein